MNSTLAAQWPILLSWRAPCSLGLLIAQLRKPMGHRRCAQMLGDWAVDWKEGDRNLQGRLLVPDGPLRKNRRWSGICPRKTKKQKGKRSIRCIKPCSGEAWWNYKGSRRHSSTQASPDCFICSLAVPRMSSWATGSTGLCKRLHIASRLRRAWSQFSFIVLFVHALSLW